MIFKIPIHALSYKLPNIDSGSWEISKYYRNLKNTWKNLLQSSQPSKIVLLEVTLQKNAKAGIENLWSSSTLLEFSIS